MSQPSSRRDALKKIGAVVGSTAVLGTLSRPATAARRLPRWDNSIQRGLAWMTRTQSRLGHWTAGNYPTAMTALAGTALLASGSTTTQGPHSRSIRHAVDYLIDKGSTRRAGGQIIPRNKGLIGDPQRDNRYTYGHGFSMLYLSQVLGEEEDEERRSDLIAMLEHAVKFSAYAQTRSGGWGYVSAKDGNDFDEGSTTITQVQGLRGCRNAGIPVSPEVIEQAKQYIYSCKNKDGGISYSSRNRGTSRPAITAAALACLYNAGDYSSEHSDEMLKYCKEQLYQVSRAEASFGHWHYTYLYYSQVVYRQGGKEWENFRDKLYDRIISEQQSDGSWSGTIGPIYITACNLIMLQLDRGYLPIYQR